MYCMREDYKVRVSNSQGEREHTLAGLMVLRHRSAHALRLCARQLFPNPDLSPAKAQRDELLRIPLIDLPLRLCARYSDWVAAQPRWVAAVITISQETERAFVWIGRGNAPRGGCYVRKWSGRVDLNPTEKKTGDK